MGKDRRRGGVGERVGIDRRSEVGGGESGDRQEWGGRGIEGGQTGGVGRKGERVEIGVGWEG